MPLCHCRDTILFGFCIWFIFLFSGVNFFRAFLITAIIIKLQPLFNTTTSRWEGKNEHWVARLCLSSFENFCSYWHGFELHGFDNIRGNNTLLVGYHSRCTLDIFYLTAKIRPRVLASHLLFLAPPFAWLFYKCGVIPSKGGKANSITETLFINLLADGHEPLMLLPGGHEEFCHGMSERDRVSWLAEPGFARLIQSNPERLGSQIQVVPFYTRNCEQIYLTTKCWHDFSGDLIKRFIGDLRSGQLWRLPIFLPVALFAPGLIVLPLPVKLDTYFGEAITAQQGESVESFASRVRDSLHSLIDSVNQREERRFPAGRPSAIMILLVGIFTIVQNLLFITLLLIVFLFVTPIILIGYYAMILIGYYSRSSITDKES